ncbi:BON domain-containing protein [Aliidiomarina quisquiliarum]|uniref:BON domain-containing protein n=1 Tax=Aliidiomarina quisquiliarum TaxID=2938947 RepID=UPI00208FB693|nr:BON domain-containing protein [Aliidiomarina quisquiliarum]MCO4321449.1 BON domain-containing protein [Aliidiomarina quisquiliarum]
MTIFRTLILAVVLPIVSGCTAIAVGGVVAGTSVLLDSREVNTQIDDTGQRLRVLQAISDDEDLSRQRIVVVAYNGDVLLVGQVINESLKQRAGRVAHEAGAPLNLFNELEVGNLATLTDRSKDTWITTRVKSQLLRDTTYDTSGIKVITENSNVFLLGIVEENIAQHAVEVARNVSGVKRVVRVFNIVN